MDRKERILAFINSEEYVPLKVKELMTVLDVPGADREELEDILDALCREGKIYQSKKGRYVSVDAEALCIAGRLSCSANGCFGFLVCGAGEEDVFVKGCDMLTALDGDKVLVRVDKDERGGRHRRGRVIKVLERANKTVVGVIYKMKDGYFCLRPDNRQIYAKIYIADKDAMTARVGDRAAVTVTGYGADGKVFGEISSVLGDGNSLKSCIEGIIVDGGIKQEFDRETLREAEKIAPEVSADMIKGREDLRDALIFTIDGDDARDFDDAVSLTIAENGNYMLGVHIADVSEYVREGGALDSEAYERGTSVYLADRVIPMLPEALSNGICSLNPNEDRLTLSVFMEISGSGKILSHRLSETVIRSKARMTYNNVNKILEENDAALCERYAYMVPTLRLMEELAKVLNKKRALRGAIEFDFPESCVTVDENGEPTGVETKTRGVSNKMIEEFMLAANETVAERAFRAELPFVYRNHEAPTVEKIKDFNNFIRPYGLAVQGKIDRDSPINPKSLRYIIDAVKGAPNERIVSITMLRSLMKARYSEENLGHFGLAAKFYCHFTSPIRRYPDLAVHRILKDCLASRLTEGRIKYLKGYTAAVSLQSTDREIDAEATERNVDDLIKTAYMSRFVGEEFEATVSSITSFGMFVELDNSIEGLIRIENMTDDYYEYDESAAELVGKRKKRVYKIGGRVNVVLAKADISLRRIDFVLAQDAFGKILNKKGCEHEKVTGAKRKKDMKRARKGGKNKANNGKKNRKRTIK